ncbi:aminomethyltransferase family protein [Nocardioides sp.]|uniref:aminomethyltransferase family protein n=1 Tax=Nocardioides sp. TaxID=35761 RepID=UPI003D0AFFF6
MNDIEAIRTAFHEVTAAQGGSHVEDGGWMWLEGFGDVPKEYAALRDDVAVWDVSPLNKWEFRGPDALRAAQRAFSNNAIGLEVGQVRYGAFLDADGLMVDDGTVFNTAREDHCWVMTNGRDHDERFGELVADLDAEFEWVTPSMPHLGVIGPRSREVVQQLTDEDLGALRYFRFIPRPIQVAGVEVYLSRTGYGGELGYELFLLDPADAGSLWNAIVGAGVTPVGTDAIEIARIEAGLIVTGYDYEPHERTPFDFNLDRMVRTGAGLDFAGEPALRALAADPPHRFVTLRYEADMLPEYGAAVSKDGDEVGILTSPTDSPRFGKIGLAVIASEQASVGNTLGVAIGDETVPATVDVLPIYDTQKKRPRA